MGAVMEVGQEAHVCVSDDAATIRPCEPVKVLARFDQLSHVGALHPRKDLQNLLLFLNNTTHDQPTFDERGLWVTSIQSYWCFQL